MSRKDDRLKWRCLVSFLLLLPMLGGCTVVSLGGAGLSVGATAVRTTGKVAGTAVDVTGSVVSVGGGGSVDDSGADSSDGETATP